MLLGIAAGRESWHIYTSHTSVGQICKNLYSLAKYGVLQILAYWGRDYYLGIDKFHATTNNVVQIWILI